MLEWVVSGSVLIAVVIALRFALRGKISLRLQYAMWALVLVRLLVPVSLGESSFGVAALMQKAARMSGQKGLLCRRARCRQAAARGKCRRRFIQRGPERVPFRRQRMGSRLLWGACLLKERRTLQAICSRRSG